MPVKLGRSRYIALRVESLDEDFKPPRKEVFNAIRDTILQLHGEACLAFAKVRVLSVSDSTIVIKCSNKYAKNILSAISLVSKIGDRPAVLDPLLISGTIKKLREKLKAYLEVNQIGDEEAVPDNRKDDVDLATN